MTDGPPRILIVGAGVRRGRVQFVVDFSRNATDTMLPGADPVAGTMRKLEPPFQDRLRRLYRDTPRAGA